MLEIESEWTTRDRESKMFGGPARPSSTQVSVQKTDANLGHQAGLARRAGWDRNLFSPLS